MKTFLTELTGTLILTLATLAHESSTKSLAIAFVLFLFITFNENATNHYNPAVSLMQSFLTDVPKYKILQAVTAQYIGASLAGAVTALLQMNSWEYSKSHEPIGITISEFVGTLILLCAIIISSTTTNSLASIVIGGSLFLSINCMKDYGETSFNPARSFGDLILSLVTDKYVDVVEKLLSQFIPYLAALVCVTMVLLLRRNENTNL